jgi:hypothetical protein
MAAWVIEGEEGSGRVSGRISIPGSSEVQSAYRNELMGILTIITLVHHVGRGIRDVKG